jgi:hypothetical protein
VIAVPLIVAVAAFAAAVFSIRRPHRVRSWMRQQAIGVLPARLQESAYAIAPTMFAIGCTVLGLGFLAVFVKDLAGLDR